MPNIASILKQEITRIARKELRSGTAKLKKASTQYRSDIAALKRRVAELEQQVVHLVKARSSTAASPKQASALRFSAKGFGAQRRRLGLSATGAGVLLGVSGQTVYNWEAGKSRPRKEQLAAIAALRDMGKREAKARLKQLSQ